MILKPHPISGYLVNIDGTKIVNPKTQYVLKPSLSPAGYLKIGNYICSGGTVHQLVYESFGELVLKGLMINHKDGVKTNNYFYNLEVVTAKQNTIHAHALGLSSGQPGENNSMAKLTNSQIFEVIDMLEKGFCNSCIGKKFMLHERYVSLIRIGKRWKSFVSGKKFPKSNKYRCLCSFATTIENTHMGK